MTPHILVLTGPDGSRYLITIQAIETIDPVDGGGCVIHTMLGGRYLCQESFGAITAALGGLVMRPKELR
jgi:hypothetical protein